MKRSLYILILAIIYLLLSARSCVDDSARLTWEEQQAELSRDSIRGEFEAGHLTEEARYASSVKAIQELSDLSDYLEIYSDKSLDSTFRKKAGDMIKRIFISEQARLSFGQAKNKKMKAVSLDEFFKTGFGKDLKKAGVIFDSIRVQQPLQKSGESTYSGKLAAFQTIIFYPLNDSIYSSSKPIIVNFISSKQAKIIGKDTLKVWEVKLGDFVPAINPY
jgi:hypothetical protein